MTCREDLYGIMGEFDTNPSEREEGKGRGFSYCYGGGKRGEN